MRGRCGLFALALAGALFGASGAHASESLSLECRRVIELYNQGTGAERLSDKIPAFEKALRLGCPDKRVLARVHNNLGDALERAGREASGPAVAREMYRKAVDEYESALKADPEFSLAATSLGDFYARVGDMEKAEEKYKEALNRASFKSHKTIVSALVLHPGQRALALAPSETLYFGLDSAGLSEKATRQLEELLRALSELKGYRFLLTGHSCDIGSKMYNLKLSESRAAAVKEWLVKKGFPAERLATAGAGKSQPDADNRTESGRQLNRRVEIRTVGVDLSP